MSLVLLTLKCGYLIIQNDEIKQFQIKTSNFPFAS